MSNRTLVESLKRLFEREKITMSQLQESMQKGTITEADYQYITGVNYE